MYVRNIENMYVLKRVYHNISIDSFFLYHHVSILTGECFTFNL